MGGYGSLRNRARTAWYVSLMNGWYAGDMKYWDEVGGASQIVLTRKGRVHSECVESRDLV